MPQRQYHRNGQLDANSELRSSKVGHERSRSPRERLKTERTATSNDRSSNSRSPNLTALIEQDAPLQAHSGLVLMYGPFQAEMLPHEGQGVASWLKECVQKHGIPSLVRFDYRRRAQIYRRDQFQPWLEPLMANVSG